MSNYNETQLTIIAAIREASLVKAQADKVNTRKQGVYATFTALAAETGKDAFESDLNAVFEAIRTNEDGLAKQVKAKPAKKEGQFTVPSAAMSAKSTLLAAYDYGVPFLGDEGEPRPFSNNRDEVKAARDAEAKAERQPHEILRDEVADMLTQLSELVAKSEPDHTMTTALEDMRDQVEALTSEYAAISGEVADEVAQAA
jgi:hypothetical protein